MDNINMLCHNRIDDSETIDVNKISKSKECDIWHHWYFLDKGFRFQLADSNGCHDVLMIFLNLNDISILNIRCADYHCIISRISIN